MRQKFYTTGLVSGQAGLVATWFFLSLRATPPGHSDIGVSPETYDKRNGTSPRLPQSSQCQQVDRHFPGQRWMDHAEGVMMSLYSSGTRDLDGVTWSTTKRDLSHLLLALSLNAFLMHDFPRFRWHTIRCKLEIRQINEKSLGPSYAMAVPLPSQDLLDFAPCQMYLPFGNE